LRSLARKNDSEIQTAPINSAPSSTDRCLTRGCHIVASLIICEVPPTLEATLQTSRKISGKPLIFRYMTHLLVPSDDTVHARKQHQKRFRGSLSFILRYVDPAIADIQRQSRELVRAPDRLSRHGTR
jgi:hypothetical protein